MASVIWFSNLLAKNNLAISDEQAENISRFVTLLSAWNQKINLVSRKDEEKIWTRHIVASIFFTFTYVFDDGSSVLDLGTGGGLPGIPLAILNPRHQFVLLDSIQKKISAVNDMILKLSLTNVKAICGRAEELVNKKELRSSFDYVVSRGVASTKDLIKWSRPFLRPAGGNNDVRSLQHDKKQIIPHPSIVLLKGGELSDELRQATIKMKPHRMEVHSVPIHGIDEAELFDKKIVVVQP